MLLKRFEILVIGCFLVGASTAYSQEEKKVKSQENLTQRVKTLELELSTLKKNIEEQTITLFGKDTLDKIHFHGYGEVHYNNPKDESMTHKDGVKLDFHRFVLGWSYEWNDSIRLEAEIDFEHAATELELEYAYLEFDIAPEASLRVGSLLMPIGPLNEFHEPPLFYSVERPHVQKNIIPTTWQENGFGIAGRAINGKLGYRAYLVSGLDGNKFKSISGIRNGRSKGSKSTADDLALVGRLEYSILPKFIVGGSLYVGGVDQDNTAINKDVRLVIFDIDARYKFQGFDIQGVFVQNSIDEADKLSTVTGETIGEKMQGWYIEVAYDLLKLTEIKDKRLMTFIRREAFDTNYKVPSGFTKNQAADREIWTVGVAFYPISKLVFKGDIELWEDGTNDKIGHINLGVAFMF